MILESELKKSRNRE